MNVYTTTIERALKALSEKHEQGDFYFRKEDYGYYPYTFGVVLHMNDVQVEYPIAQFRLKKYAYVFARLILHNKVHFLHLKSNGPFQGVNFKYNPLLWILLFDVDDGDLNIQLSNALKIIDYPYN